MLFFHGTRGDRDHVDAIAREGLRAHRSHWVHDAVGHAASTFLANAPVAGSGGDPVAFAMGFGARASIPGDGWIIVVDLPRAAWDVIRAVVPNRELEHYFTARTLKPHLAGATSTLDDAGAIERGYSAAPPLVQVLAELGRRDDLAHLARSLRPMLTWRRHDLRAESFTFARWSRYADALRAAKTLDDVARAGRHWGFTWDEPEVPHCALCVQGMATWHYAIDAALECAWGHGVALPALISGRDLLGDGLAAHARFVARAYAGATPAAVAAAFARLAEEHRHLAWDDVLKRTPIDAAALPPSWGADYGRHWSDRDVSSADVQVVCDAIAPERIVGALRLSTGARFRPWARPRGGETLAAKLWHAATVVRARYRGRCVVYDG